MNDKMTSNSNLKERIKYVSKIVATWPKWKQDLLGYPIRKRGKQMSDKMTDGELVEAVKKQWPGSIFVENVSNDLLNKINYKECRAILEAILKAKGERE